MNVLEFTNISDFLKASPFDPEYDLNRTLTPDIFYAQFHVESARSLELERQLRALLESAYEPNRVIFVSGFAGNGKTTFLRTFMRNAPEYRHIYYDLQEQRFAVQAAPQRDRDDEVKLLLDRHLRSMPEIEQTFEFLQRNRHALRESGFISSQLCSQLGTTPVSAGIESTYIRHCMATSTIKDTFTLLFLQLFLTSARGQKTIVYFDNLDVSTMEYIADEFLVYFQGALSTALYLSRHEMFDSLGIDFRTDYRFIFCLREANEATLNAHLSDRIGLPRSPFRVSFDGAFYKAVAEKRIRFVEDHFPDQDSSLSGGSFLSIFNQVLTDTYFRDVFLPLFNYDYREIAGVLVRVIHRYILDDRRDARKADRGYRTRAVLLFGIVENLLHRDFMRDYLVTPPETDDGYCYLDRVMLTVLINASDYQRFIASDNDSGGDPYGLLYLVKDLIPVYRDMDRILSAIGRCFLSHQQNRVHLVTLLNSRVDDLRHFVRKNSLLFDQALREDDSVESVRLDNELKAIQVRANPSGFAYVRYVLPHFEFYANLAGNQASLFDDPLRPVEVGRNSAYAFEAKIDAVLKLVHRHAARMKMFFERRYTPVGITPESFGHSKYCFRHEGTSRKARPAGHSHTVRVLTSQIDYIDHFRRWLLRDSSVGDEKKRFLNKLLVGRIRSYVDMFELAIDIDAAFFAESFEHPIRVIEHSDYGDFTTGIWFEHGSESQRSEVE